MEQRIEKYQINKEKMGVISPKNNNNPIAFDDLLKRFYPNKPKN